MEYLESTNYKLLCHPIGDSRADQNQKYVIVRGRIHGQNEFKIRMDHGHINVDRLCNLINDQINNLIQK